MPEMNGFEATAAIRRRERHSGRHTPIIAMTARAMKGDREECLSAGMDDYVSKPFRAIELFEAIDGLTHCFERDETEAAVGELLIKNMAEKKTDHRYRAAGLPTSDHRVKREPYDNNVLDMDALLGNTMGNIETARAVAEVFFERCPEWLSDLRSRIADNDSEAVSETAHKLKGSLGGIQAMAAFQAALRLEICGKENNLTEAVEAMNILEQEIERLKGAFDEFLSDPMVCTS